jgi:hypothetical protein
MSRRQAQQIKQQEAKAKQVTLVDSVSLNIKETTRFPLPVDVMTDGGGKEQMVIRKPQQVVQLQLKLTLMRHAPQLFYDNDPHWKHIKDGEIVLNHV